VVLGEDPLSWWTGFNRLANRLLELMLLRSSSWVAPLLLIGRCAGNVDASDTQQDLIRWIDQKELSREARLAGYTVTEYYTIRNSHFSRPAEATIETTYKRGQGKTYKVLSRSGPSLLRNRVLDRLLQEETQMSRGRTRARSLLTSANYEMKLVGRDPVDNSVFDVVELIPKRKSPFLLKGRMWVDPARMMIVKIEGRPPASASFFVGRPQVVRQYTQIDGFPLAQHSHAVSSSFFFGQSTIDIEYRNYHVITSKR
jgi:hypothetical protein